VVAVGGLEPSGRVGLLADAEAIRARGGVPVLVAAAVTAQGRRTFAWQPVSVPLLTAQLRAACELGPVAAVKLGMLPTAGHLRGVQRVLRGLDVPWVVDPVVRASSGGSLSALSARAYLGLAGQRTWLTPNASEAAWLAGTEPLDSVGEARAAALALLRQGFGGVLLKGGHLKGRAVVDVLAVPAGARALRGTRLSRTAGQGGTGCRLASALATELARGTRPALAVARARHLVRRYLRAPAGAAKQGPG
jgi:hydroxymethylpyrimidine/phosphomethylpyrimidine kinase